MKQAWQILQLRKMTSSEHFRFYNEMSPLNTKYRNMKTIKYILVLFILGLFINSCKEENLEEYPGNIIIHSDVLHMVLHGPDNDAPAQTKRNARFYAYSGGSDYDLSAMSPTDWTYEMWIKVPNDAMIGDRTISNSTDAGGAFISERAKNFELYLVDDDDADFAIKYNRMSIDGVAIDSMCSHNSSVNLSFDTWTHVAISRASSDGLAKFYINGKLIDSSDDPLWIQPVNDTWLQFNYVYRNGEFLNMFKGEMKNIRVSTIDRYPTEFTPELYVRYNETVDSEGNIIEHEIDENTLLQLNLEKNLTPFDEGSSNYKNFNKIEIKGFYDPYYIKIHKTLFSWQGDIVDEYPITGY